MSRIGGPISTRKRSRWLAGTRRTSGPRPTRELRRTLARTRRSRRGRRSPARRRGHAPRGGRKFPARGGRSSGPPAGRRRAPAGRRRRARHGTRTRQPSALRSAARAPRSWHAGAAHWARARTRRCRTTTAVHGARGRVRGSHRQAVAASGAVNGLRFSSAPSQSTLAGVHDPTPSRRLRGAEILQDALVREPRRGSAGLRAGDLGHARSHPRGVPMWFAVRGDSLVLATGSDSRKAANLRRAPLATVVVHDSRSGCEVCGVCIRGSVELVGGESARPLVEHVHRRYVRAEAEALVPVASFSALTTLP